MPRIARRTSCEKIDALIRLWDLASGKVTGELEGTGYVKMLAFSQDGKMIAAASQDQTLHLWDRKSSTELRRFGEAKDSWASLAFSPDGKILAFEGEVRPQVLRIAFAPDGRTLISDRPDGSLRVWDVAAGRQIRQLKVGEEGYPCLFAYSSDGRTLAVRSKDGTIRLLEAATGAEKRRLTGGMKYGSSLCFSPDGGKLASMSSSSRDSGSVLQLWDISTGEEKLNRTFACETPIVFSPDGKTLLGILPDGRREITLRPLPNGCAISAPWRYWNTSARPRPGRRCIPWRQERPQHA